MEYNDIHCNYYKLKIKKCRSKRFKRILFLVICLFVLILSLCLYYLNHVVNPVIYSYGKIEIDRLFSTCGNDAISQVSGENIYNDFIEIKYDKDGSITTIKANIEKINKVSNILAQRMQFKLNENSEIGIKIPIGTLSGIGFLTGRGHKINFAFNPIGSVVCNFYTSFTSAGINQTSHKIFVSLQSKISLILPFKSEIFQNKLDYLISESLIVGKVPNTYLNITDLKKLNSL